MKRDYNKALARSKTTNPPPKSGRRSKFTANQFPAPSAPNKTSAKENLYREREKQTADLVSIMESFFIRERQ